MKVFKFGGASVNNAERIRKLPEILKVFSGEKLLVVISAMGKTTNALEKVAEAFYSGNKEKAIELFSRIKQDHLDIAADLLSSTGWKNLSRLPDFFTEVEWLLHDRPGRDYDYYYDQIVSIGELLSTSVISDYLNDCGITNRWMDVRDVFVTDNQFRAANLDWTRTAEHVRDLVEPCFRDTDLVLTQGFIGSTDANENTTLGREGSDYSAAIFANLLHAASVTIWKDVEGLMNADPKAFPGAQVIPSLDYDEVIEMAFYGAQVIHPKTIKPLQNRNIPLYVRCFTNPQLPGTVIHSKHIRQLPAIIVVKKNQTLIHLRSKDFSFVGEESTAGLYSILSALHIQANLIQTGAVILEVCVDENEEKTKKLAQEASGLFDVETENGLTLITVRHYQQGEWQSLLDKKEMVLQQWSRETVQTLVRPLRERLQP
jgi:aspartate kinase